VFVIGDLFGGAFFHLLAGIVLGLVLGAIGGALTIGLSRNRSLTSDA
jgi:F0F1-type ATP synthase membrane subunit c/vacuolar-type H+-ATPase subunit K